VVLLLYIQLFWFFHIATPYQPLRVSRSVCSVDFEKVRFENGDEDELSRDELEKIMLPISARTSEDFDHDAEVDGDGDEEDKEDDEGRSRGSGSEMMGIDLPISVTTAVSRAASAATVVAAETQALGGGGFAGLLESDDEECGESDEDPEVRG